MNKLLILSIIATLQVFSAHAIGFDKQAPKKENKCANTICTQDICPDGYARSEYNGNCCSCDPKRLLK